MGKSKACDKILEDADGNNNFLTRDDLKKLSMDMQRKLDDFANGQIELSRQQAAATRDFNKRFDQLTMLLSNQKSTVPTTRGMF
jgi:hypothetical protein